MKRLTDKQKKDWEILVRNIRNSTSPKKESKEEKETRFERCKSDYNFFCRYYFAHYADSDCAPYHLEIADNILRNRIITQFNIVYRGGAKSVHSNLMVPLWLLFFHDELHFMLIVGENDDKSGILLRDIQAELQFNQKIISDFGEQFQFGHWSDGEFKIKNNTLFKAIGINMSARGLRNQNFRPDYISIDDIEDRKKANNQQIVQERVDKILGDIAGSFSKDFQRLVVSNNLIHKKGVIATLLNELKNKDTARITWANAIDEKGNPTWERYSKDYWATKKQETRQAQWEREYMNNPVEEGLIFKSEWIRYSDIPSGDIKEITAYGDLSYKTSGDYKAIIAGAKIAGKFYIVDCFIRKSSLNTAISWCYDFRKSIAPEISVKFKMEASFIQDMFLDSFYEEGQKRGNYLYVSGDKRVKPEKFTRIEAISTLFERGLILFSDALKDSPDTEVLIEQLLLFEKGSSAHDDGPDALEGLTFDLNSESKSSGFWDLFFINKKRKQY